MAGQSKYRVWGNYLSQQTEDNIAVSLEALVNILGEPIPQSAHQRTWWANTPKSPQAKAWLTAGYKVDGFHGNTVTFTRLDTPLAAEEPKRRGRPPKEAAKAVPEGVPSAPKKRGRPPKAKTEAEATPAKRKYTKRAAAPVVQDKPAKRKYTKRGTVAPETAASAAPENTIAAGIAVLGTGNLGSAILQGIAGNQAGALKEFTLYDKDADKAALLAQKYKATLAASANEAANSGILLLTVKPAQLADVLDGIGAELADAKPLVVSTAAGWTLAQLETKMPSGTAAARIMPNLNAAVGQSATVYSVNSFVTQEQKAALVRLLESFGSALEIDESRFGAHLALSGAGPAFVYLFADALARAGVRLGLPRTEALEAAVQTLLGSAHNLKESNVHPQELVDRVCSPGGITIEGVLALEKTGFASNVAGAVSAAFEKNPAL
ncbi:MAG: pyrroline-5-carboxylate reductase [Oscillospiraceae bacterium]|jgi:pyrroline-5-carboxylate reductase|nr:pyrroline-5-carboxylate reductase [Oscillospiraceae bacterium]